MSAEPGAQVALLVTCLADAFAPQVAQSAAQLVRVHGGADVVLVSGCCGQPAWNAGHPHIARRLARRLIPTLAPYGRIVVPSGSCATMLVRYYPHLFPARHPLFAEANRVAARTVELSRYLAEHGVPELADPPKVAFHPSCHSLRGADVGDAGERCLASAGCQLCQQADARECCGFGGLFAVKQSRLSVAMADRKLDALLASGADTVVAGELGCLLHLEGRARRRGLPLRFRHLAEVLGGDASDA